MTQLESELGKNFYPPEKNYPDFQNQQKQLGFPNIVADTRRLKYDTHVNDY